ncbi:glycoside hydrolase superfamily [Thelonectria olida]|uniref:Beta-hexosaminidase n=1 Tax=Thelonectria olida TaxID=1576542 RepID=A0A9P8W1A5_9HYPO|nr:glycoside hydrolase superfamily [Thelonectria olida]
MAAVWPRPRTVDVAEEVVWFSPEAVCQYRQLDNQKSAEETANTVARVFERTKESILKFPLVLQKLRRQDVPIEPPIRTAEATIVRDIVVEEVISNPKEWYHLHLGTDGKCLIKIGSHVAFNRAMATFAQLFLSHPDGQSGLYCASCPLTIEDDAFFEHRGLNLDISRNVIYPTDVLRVLEGMWLNKMNKLHVHATDSQSWPLEIPSIPELAEKGAYGPHQVWTAADVEHVQQFGQDRGIEVYFEIDLPGHSASVHHSFPELVVAYNQQPWTQYAKEPPAGQLKLKSKLVRDFISRLFDDLLPRVAKHSTLFHIGGDELNKKAYTLEEGVESDSIEVLQPLLQSFFDHCIAKLDENGLDAVLWEEVLLKWDIKFPKSTIIQSWRSQESLSRIVKRGHRALFGPSKYWYLDTGMGNWLEPDPNNPDTPIKPPFHDWCPPYKNWRHIYAYNPLEGIEEANRGLVHGGEVHLWSEMVDSVCLDFMLWPRVAAAAEVLWSGPSTLDEGVTLRLAEMRERLVLMGIRSNMVQMEWSLRNPGGSLR